MRRLAVLLALLLLPVLPLEPAAAQEDPVLRGRVLRADGTALTTGAVRVTEKTGLLEVLVEVGATLLTLGLPLLDCLNDSPTLRLCRDARESAIRLDAEGRFALPVPDGVGDYTVAVNGLVGESAGRALITLEVDVPAEGLALPDLQLWQARARSGVAEGRVVVQWDPLPEGSSYAVDLQPARAGAPTAPMEVSGDRATVDSRLLEDAPGSALVRVQGSVDGYDVTWLALPVAYAAPSGPPLSRGRPCRVQVGGAVEAAPRCWLDDGRVDQPAPAGLTPPTCRVADGYERCTYPPLASVVLDLGAQQPLGLVVLRGDCRRCTVATSSDRVTWDEVDVRYELAGPTVVDVEGRSGRWVRLGVQGEPVGRTTEELSFDAPAGDPFVFDPFSDEPFPEVNDLSGVSEVSVWGPRPRPPAASRGLDAPGQLLPGAREALGVAAPLLALLLLVLTTAGVAIAWDRSRR